jgi:hypothetical protein
MARAEAEANNPPDLRRGGEMQLMIDGCTNFSSPSQAAILQLSCGTNLTTTKVAFCLSSSVLFEMGYNCYSKCTKISVQ